MDLELLEDCSEAIRFDSNRLKEIFEIDNEGIVQESAEEITVLIDYIQNNLKMLKTELGMDK